MSMYAVWCVLHLMGFSECGLARNWKAPIILPYSHLYTYNKFSRRVLPFMALWQFLVMDSTCHLLHPPIATWFMNPQLSHGWTVEHRCSPVSAHQPWPFHAAHTSYMHAALKISTLKRMISFSLPSNVFKKFYSFHGLHSSCLSG